MTAEEIRKLIIETVSRNGGHLASSLGTVELCIALSEVFDPCTDKIVWDVGHQSYAWKIITGRKEAFSTLRQLDGISGFPNPAESKADAAIAGHAGVALSVAEGYAASRDLRGTGEHVVAVIGDSSIVNGVALEALNNCAFATKKVIVILNDNGMSISKPTGSISRLLSRLITSVRYNRVKAAAEKTGHALRLTFLRRFYHATESAIKSLFLGNSFFENFGIRYIGPVDGHDIGKLQEVLMVAKEDKRSVLVHIVTKKGRGFGPAEKNPTKWHGVSPFNLAAAERGETEAASVAKRCSWSDCFGALVCRLAREDSRIVALTAGMKDGTALNNFASEFPQRFYDVGINEEHMVAFAAGLAAGGMKPVVAVYSTFLQRAIDQVVHDVAIASLPVVFCVDRAGVVGADGVTHQGIYDIAMLRAVPNLTICEPKDADDFEKLMREALRRSGPTVIRYPRGKIPEQTVAEECGGSMVKRGKWAIWATGDWYPKAHEIAAALDGVAVHARYIKPVDFALLAEQRNAGMKIASLENAAVIGGLGEAIGADAKFGWPDEFIPHGSQEELEKRYSLDVQSILTALKNK